LRVSTSAAAREGEQLALGVLLVRLAHRSIELQCLQAPPVRLGLARACRGSFELLAGGLLGEPVIDIVDHGEDVPLAHRLADVDAALHDLAADTKRLLDFVSRLHGAEVAARVSRAVVAHCDRAHRPKRLLGRRGRSARGEQRSDGYRDCG
jgi:hypothetical protein